MDKEKITAVFSNERIIAEDSDLARILYDKGRFGEIQGKKRVQYALFEALYLLETQKMEVIDGRRKELTFDGFIKKANRIEKKFWTRYSVYKNLRGRGYIVKTALKFGADFRAYDRGVKPGQDHAKWTVLAVDETSQISWYEFAAQNRVAHSTRKKLLIGIVDKEDDVTYYEVAWTRP